MKAGGPATQRRGCGEARSGEEGSPARWRGGSGDEESRVTGRLVEAAGRMRPAVPATGRRGSCAAAYQGVEWRRRSGWGQWRTTTSEIGREGCPDPDRVGGGGESSGGASGGYGLGFPQSGDMGEGSGAPAGPAWLAQRPAGLWPSGGGGGPFLFLSLFFC